MSLCVRAIVPPQAGEPKHTIHVRTRIRIPGKVVVRLCTININTYCLLYHRLLLQCSIVYSTRTPYPFTLRRDRGYVLGIHHARQERGGRAKKASGGGSEAFLYFGFYFTSSRHSSKYEVPPRCDYFRPAACSSQKIIKIRYLLPGPQYHSTTLTEIQGPFQPKSF